MGDRAGEAKLPCAPRWRRMLALAIDMTVAGLWAWRRRPRWSDGTVSGTEPSVSDRLLGPASELAREQLGSPGERLGDVELTVSEVSEHSVRRLILDLKRTESGVADR